MTITPEDVTDASDLLRALRTASRTGRLSLLTFPVALAGHKATRVVTRPGETALVHLLSREIDPGPKKMSKVDAITSLATLLKELDQPSRDGLMSEVKALDVEELNRRTRDIRYASPLYNAPRAAGQLAKRAIAAPVRSIIKDIRKTKGYLQEAAKGGPGSGFSDDNCRRGIPGQRGGSINVCEPGGMAKYESLKREHESRQRESGLSFGSEGFTTASQSMQPIGVPGKVNAQIVKEIERVSEPVFSEDGIQGTRTSIIARVKQNHPVDEDAVREVYAQSTRGDNAVFYQLMAQLVGNEDHGFNEGEMNAAQIDRLLSADLYSGQTAFAQPDIPSIALPDISEFGRSMESRDTLSLPMPEFAPASFEPSPERFQMRLEPQNIMLGGGVAPEIGRSNAMTHHPTHEYAFDRPMLLGSGR